MSAEIVEVKMRRQRGWWVATSEDIPGLYVAHIDANKVLEDIPVTIKALYAFNGIDIEVMDASYARGESTSELPWVMIPAHVAASQMASA